MQFSRWKLLDCDEYKLQATEAMQLHLGYAATRISSPPVIVELFCSLFSFQYYFKLTPIDPLWAGVI
jgi:hypothetical protein